MTRFQQFAFGALCLVYVATNSRMIGAQGGCDVVTVACGPSPTGLQAACNSTPCDQACAKNGTGQNGPYCLNYTDYSWDSLCGPAAPAGKDGSGNPVYCSDGLCGCTSYEYIPN